MARPMLLIPARTLKRLYEEYRIGVPVAKIIRKYNLNISKPSLGKLIKYYAYSLTAPSQSTIKIHESLFPKWLDNDLEADRVQSQPSNYSFSGKMPFVTWFKVTPKLMERYDEQ